MEVLRLLLTPQAVLVSLGAFLGSWLWGKMPAPASAVLAGMVLAFQVLWVLNRLMMAANEEVAVRDRLRRKTPAAVMAELHCEYAKQRSWGEGLTARLMAATALRSMLHSAARLLPLPAVAQACLAAAADHVALPFQLALCVLLARAAYNGWWALRLYRVAEGIRREAHAARLAAAGSGGP